MDKVNVGLIGIGYWGQKILNELNNHPSVDSVYPISRTNSLLSVDQLLQKPDVSHVLIVTPVATHYELCKKALLAGKHVMCEKNFTQTYEEAIELCHLATTQEVNLLVDFIYSFNPIFERVRLNRGYFKVEIIQNGAFRDEHIMSMLGCHALSVAAKYRDIENLNPYIVHFTDDSAFVNYGDSFAINISRTASPGVKIRKIVTDTGSIDFQYENGIRLMIDKFLNGETNRNMILNIAKLMEKTYEQATRT